MSWAAKLLPSLSHPDKLSQSLFRDEALSAVGRSEVPSLRFSSNVEDSYLLVLSLLVSILIFLGLAYGSFDKQVKATGVVYPLGGQASFFAHASGTLVQVNIREGESVRKGQIVAVIHRDIRGRTGELHASDKQDYLAERRAIENRDLLVQSKAIAEQTLFVSRISNLTDVGNSLSLALKRELATLDLFRAQIAVFGTAARDRTISTLTYHSELLSLAQLETAHTQLVNSFAENREKLDELRQAELDEQMTSQTNHLDAQKQISEISRFIRAEDADVDEELVAPFDGVISAVQYMVGERVDQDRPLAMIYNANEGFRVKLKIPAASIAEVKVGNRVRLSLDAFPTFLFGYLDGKVTEISHAPVASSDSGSAPYNAYVSIEWSSIRKTPRYNAELRPGLGVTAHIVTGVRSIGRLLLAGGP